MAQLCALQIRTFQIFHRIFDSNPLWDDHNIAAGAALLDQWSIHSTIIITAITWNRRMSLLFNSNECSNFSTRIVSHCNRIVTDDRSENCNWWPKQEKTPRNLCFFRNNIRLNDRLPLTVNCSHHAKFQAKIGLFAENKSLWFWCTDRMSIAYVCVDKTQLELSQQNSTAALEQI